jgi:two-component system, LytTR family, sensor kinase
MRRVWKPLAVLLGAALAISLFESIGLHLRNLSLGRQLPWYDPFWRPLPHWLTMAIAAPIAIGLSYRFRVRPGAWRYLALHGVAAILFGLVHTVLGTIVYGWILGSPKPLLGMVRSQLSFDIAPEVLSYAILAVGTHAYLWYDDARREREAAARARADLSQARLRILRSQLRPHVLFNTLQAISTLALRREHEAVVTAIARLSDVLRAALDGDAHEEIPLGRELEVVDSYLEIHQLRMGSRLQVERQVDADALVVGVPPLLLQPLVENALEHGLANGRGGTVSLGARRDRDSLVLSVTDDGYGVARGEARDGTGLRVTRDRLRELYGDQQSLSIEPRPGGGTVVRVVLPWRPLEAPGP